ncbi:DUF5131 family protein [Streptomyces nanshensis]|uniref:DUF5131 family protein n=1 Tax=Streptomyces nanshensis TaxID=518642 RepID=UPI00085BD590|nr:DUF5131 family protein [Streptomyces nanshensis]
MRPLRMSPRAAVRWRRARTLNDLGRCTADWLEGRLSAHPERPRGCGPDNETRDLIEHLAHFNRQGYQPAPQDFGRHPRRTPGFDTPPGEVMGANSRIEWTTRTWNPTIGCRRVSSGCDGCYAIGEANIRKSNPNPKVADAFAGTVHHADDGRLDWTGHVNLLPQRLPQPLKWKKGERVFVDSLCDLFYDEIPVDYVAAVFAIMALTPQHTYQILTKRPRVMAAMLADECTCGAGHAPGTHFRSEMAWAVSAANPNGIPGVPDDAEELVNSATWPLPNVHLGISAEDQKTANLRIPHLLHTPAAVRFVSLEPLLGPISLTRLQLPTEARKPTEIVYDVLRARYGTGEWYAHTAARLDWVIIGGESGSADATETRPAARPPHPKWFRSLITDCALAGVPVFFKQWGNWSDDPPADENGKPTPSRSVVVATDGTVYEHEDLSYPDGPRRREALDAGHARASLTAMYWHPKKPAPVIDGAKWQQFPTPARTVTWDDATAALIGNVASGKTAPMPALLEHLRADAQIAWVADRITVEHAPVGEEVIIAECLDGTPVRATIHSPLPTQRKAN